MSRRARPSRPADVIAARDNLDCLAGSAVICTLIQEMRSIVEGLAGSDTAGDRGTEQELTSLRQLAAAA